MLETVTDSHGITYKRLPSGTCYHIDTDPVVVELLEWARRGNMRLHFHFGDTATGEDWNEEYDVEGYIGRSNGSIKVPLLIHNSNSSGGGAILDQCIVKISLARGGAVIYQHSRYQPPVVTITESDLSEYTHNVLINGDLYARCNSLKEANRLAAWMVK